MAKSDVWTLNFNNVAQSTRQSPIITPAAGITSFEVVLTRANLDPAIVMAWSIELSRNGGASWLPWGGATTNGLISLDEQGQPFAESFFLVWLDAPADAQTRVRATLTNTGARMTTRITIRGDTQAIPARAMPQTHQSVTYDTTQSVVSAGTVASLTTPSMTIADADYRVALLGLITNATGTTDHTSTCGGVVGRVVPGANTGVEAGSGCIIHYVLSPQTGSRTATMAWTTTCGSTMGVVIASSVDHWQTVRGYTSSGSSATPSITVPTAVGDLTFAIGWPANSLSAPTQTQVWLDTTVTGGGGSRGPGTQTSDVHAWTQTSGAWVMAGANLIAHYDLPPIVAGTSRPTFPKFLLRPTPRAESV